MLAVQRALDAGVTQMLSIGTGEGPPIWKLRSEWPNNTNRCSPASGLHPEHAPKVTQADYDRLRELLAHPKVLLLGEIGLDYYWKPYDAKQQADVFVQQMQIATLRGSRSAFTRATPGMTRSGCFDPIGRRPGCRASCTASPAIPSRPGRRWTSDSTSASPVS